MAQHWKGLIRSAPIAQHWEGLMRSVPMAQHALAGT